MDYPKSVSGLLLLLDLEVADLQLSCIFCKCSLTARDLSTFDRKELHLVWRKGYPFGACGPCLLGAAQVDIWRHFDCSVYGTSVQDICGIALNDLYVRCYGCYKPLTNSEKDLMVEEKKRLHCVRGYWRGLCLMCGCGYRV
ncbi:E6 [Ailuropoda melanoleuca papillomavirus 1]|uniref:Protein E6 n=1 Tax=Ailuropoda melanoleuca papillomavirus 1 TaxID=2016454 RepID=A0A220IGE0_9PAPI|nr:E6 [Ailuropoda melanoleuca papillomavirus 1]ASH99052.1 E6 [Ailuropoda melanoleuca papillomavirus 1]